MCRLGAILFVLLAVSASAVNRHGGKPVLLKPEDLSLPVEADLLLQQYAALSAMPGVVVKYSANGSVMSVKGDTGVVLPASVRGLVVGDSAPAVIDAFRAVLLATGSETLTVKRNHYWPPGDRSIRFDQSIRGIPVVDGLVAVNVNEVTGRVSYLGSLFLPDRNLPTEPLLSRKHAWQALVRTLEASKDAKPGSVQENTEPRLAYLGAGAEALRPQLVWEAEITFTCPTGRQDYELVWIDAIDGSIAGRRSTISYITSPGPCQKEELVQADCESAPHPMFADASYSSSCQASSARPKLVVTRIACTNSFRLLWPRNPGASQYHVISARADLGWAFTRTVAAGQIHQCTTTVDAPTLVKMRPCDGCGCGEWSETLLMDPQAVCETADP